MAFPTTGILDSFTRANGALGANWGVLNSYGTGLTVISNAAGGAGGAQGSYWSASTFGADSEVFGTLGVAPANTENMDMMLGIGTPAGAWNGYGFEMSKAAGTDTTVIYRSDAGALTTLGASISQEYIAGDSIGMNRLSGVFQLWINPAGSGWTSVGTTRSDATYPAAGNIAMFVDSATTRIDDFGGGTVVTAGATAPKNLAAIGVG